MKVVLLLAAGAGWETRALSVLSGRRDVVVLKRCVDVDDLLATAASGQADTAVVALEAPGLDLAAVDHLRGHRVRVVGVLPGGAQSQVVEQAAVRASRIGIRATVLDSDLTALPAVVVGEDDGEEENSAEPPEDAAARPSAPGGRVLAVWGPAGAPGRTTVATTLAAALSRHTRTTLVDVDPCGGAVAQVLGVLDEVSGLLAAARLAGGGLLEERFASVQRALDPRFTVVTGLPRPDRWTEVRPGTVELLAATARAQGHVVLDTGSSLDEDDVSGRPGRHRMTLAALDAADEVLVVGNADPVGLSRLAHALVDLGERRPATPVRVVVNRMRPTIGWSERDVGQMLTDFARPAGLHFLPEDRATTDRALVTGRSVLETDAESPLATAVLALAAAVSGAPSPGRRPSPLRRRWRPAS
jgi:MinD-like ATPase involved in chromosome partitioning or flagellar assembly